ncbi:hypothetical protein G6F68_018083 [Rhizopus microsporus]|nr:hypothetical protein G6F68_018083 [Rhizopus microsporus]
MEHALKIADRGAFALASIKGAFNARHGGVGGLSRMAHDLLLRGYLDTSEHDELAASFAEKRAPDAGKPRTLPASTTCPASGSRTPCTRWPAITRASGPTPMPCATLTGA